VSGAEGVVLVDHTGERTLVATPVARAFPDGRGGVIYQTPEPEGWPFIYDNEAGREVVNPDYPGSVVWWQPTLSAEPLPLTDPTIDPLVSLVGVLLADGRTQVLYTTTLPGCSAADVPTDVDWQAMWCSSITALMVTDLDTGTWLNLGLVGSYESDGLFLAPGPVATATEVNPYGDSYSLIGPIDTDDLLAGTSSRPHWDDQRWVYSLIRDWSFDTSQYCGHDDGCNHVWVTAAPAPDGSTIAVAWGREIRTANPDGTTADIGAEPSRLTILDAATGAVIDEMPLASEGLVPSSIEFDGRRAIVGFNLWPSDPVGPVLVDTLDRTVEPLPGPAGEVAFWNEGDA
jgi:hypothetical protein